MKQTIPRPDLQRKYTQITGDRISVAAVQWLMHHKREGMTDDEAIAATKAVFDKAAEARKLGKF